VNKYIFLDIDGVLWTIGWSVYAERGGKRGERMSYRQWDPIASSNLQWVLDKVPRAKVVISSTWRMGRSLKELRSIAKRSGIDPRRIVGATPVMRTDKKSWRFFWWGWGTPHGRKNWWRPFSIRYCVSNVPRGREIQRWMDKRRVKAKNIAILDDDTDMAHLRKRLVKTCSMDGLGFKKALELLDMLGGARKR